MRNIRMAKRSGVPMHIGANFACLPARQGLRISLLAFTVGLLVFLTAGLVSADGTGADGALNVTANFNINSQTQQGARGANADAVNFSADVSNGLINNADNSIILSAAPTGLAINDEVLIINLKGTSGDYYNVGNYETKKISAINVNTITFTQPISNTYGDANTQKIMVQRVPNYTDVTVQSGITLTADAWGGTKGGVLFFRATGTVTVTVTGTINMNITGFRGGAGGTTPTPGYGGETYNGTGGTGGAPGSSLQGGGGGGNTSSYAGGSGSIGSGGGGGGAQGGGGGGGGYGGAGNGGGGTNNGGSGGTGQYGTGGTGGTGSTYAGGGGGGGTVGELTLSKMYLGGGGGGGGRWGTSGAGAGGTGGGIIFISANAISVSGSIQSNGGAGGNTGGYVGGGGSAGGSIYLRAQTVTLGTSLVSATGGGGGDGSLKDGGTGGVGRIRLDYYNKSGTTNPPAYTYQDMSYAPNLTSPGNKNINETQLLNFTLSATGPENYQITYSMVGTPTGSTLNSSTGVFSWTPTGSQSGNYSVTFTATAGGIPDSKTITITVNNINHIRLTETNNISKDQTVAMGNSIPYCDFKLRLVNDANTSQKYARWKRFRIDKYTAPTATECPSEKVVVQVWAETSKADSLKNDWDAGTDTIIQQGNFAIGKTGVCWLNMNRYKITTTAQKFYIVFKLANDCPGGSRLGFKVPDSSYLEFEDAAVSNENF